MFDKINIDKSKLEKITVSSCSNMRNLQYADIKDKYIVITTVEKGIIINSLEGCVIEGGVFQCNEVKNCNVYGVEYASANEITNSFFINCKHVELNPYGDRGSMYDVQFYSCEQIQANDSTIKDIIFDEPGDLYFDNCDISYCMIRDVESDDGCVICLDEGKMRNCEFSNITIKDEGYLIEGFGNPWVENCAFNNISTDREDKELFLLEETKGVIFKKKVRYEFVDTESCSGLDKIILTED